MTIKTMLIGRRIAGVIDDPQTLQYVRDLSSAVYLRFDGVRLQGDESVPEGVARYVTKKLLPPKPNWFLDMIRAAKYSLMDSYMDNGRLKVTLYYNLVQNPPIEMMMPAGYEYISSGISHLSDYTWQVIVYVDENKIHEVAEAGSSISNPWNPTIAA